MCINTQSYQIFIREIDRNYKTEVESIDELRTYIQSVSSQFEPDMTYLVSITRQLHITLGKTKLPVEILGPWNMFRNFDFFVVDGKIPTVSKVAEYIKSKKYNVYPEKPKMHPDALAYPKTGIDPNLYLLKKNIVTDIDLKQIHPYKTSKTPTSLLSFFGSVTINGILKLR